MLFTPNNSGQRLPPTYYRGCWHVVSRGFLVRYRQHHDLFEHGAFVPNNRVLQSEDLHHSRGVAPSDFRPLRKSPHCCLPEEFGPCLSPNVAVHPLRPATDHRLGEPLPHQLANQTRAHLPAIACKQRPSFLPPPCGGGSTFGISIPFGMLSPTGGQVAHALLTRSPLRTYRNKFSVRLACVKHAASVRPEPGSNSPK